MTVPPVTSGVVELAACELVRSPLTVSRMASSVPALIEPTAAPPMAAIHSRELSVLALIRA
jgi:hypothetical protein